MAYTPIVIGSLNWGAPVNNAFTSQDARISNREAGSFTPDQHALLSWNFDPSMAPANDILTSGEVRMIKMPSFAKDVTISSIALFVAAVAVTPVAGQNFAGIYNAAGTRLAQTADLSTPYTVAGFSLQPLTASILMPANTSFWVAFLSNAATNVSLAAGLSVSVRGPLVNANLTAANFRYSLGPSAQTTLPASITMASRTTLPRSPWAGVA